MDLTDFGWKRTRSGKYSHPDLSERDGRVRLFSEKDALHEQKRMERQQERQLNLEFRQILVNALTQPIETGEQVIQRCNLLEALGLPYAAMAVRFKYRDLLQ